jgi:hypothetical protein
MVPTLVRRVSPGNDTAGRDLAVASSQTDDRTRERWFGHVVETTQLTAATDVDERDHIPGLEPVRRRPDRGGRYDGTGPHAAAKRVTVAVAPLPPRL